MPNELKLPLDGSTSLSSLNRSSAIGSSSKKSSGLGSSSLTVMVWTISGIVLAACSSTKYVNRTDSGSTSLAPGGSVDGGTKVRAVDGPVKGAAIYFDLNGNGEVSDAERKAQTDSDGRPFYITDENGQAAVPDRFAAIRFVAVVEGATDTSTGEVLSGEFYSLANGAIATPITDLLKDAPGDDQTVLNEIYGMDDEGNPKVKLSDVVNHENYEFTADPGSFTNIEPTPPAAPTAPDLNPQEQTGDLDFQALQEAYNTQLKAYNAALAEYEADLLKFMISRSAIALTELDQDSDLFGTDNDDTPANRIKQLKAIFTPETTDDNAALNTAITERETRAAEILEGKPVAAPDPYTIIDEDEVLSISAYLEATKGDDDIADLEALFGFIDPTGNSAVDATSSFRGIYIKSTVANGKILFGDNPTTATALATHKPTTGDPVPDEDSLPSTPSGETFYYVSYGQISQLVFKPDANYFGTLDIDYYIYDAVQFSEKATLKIIVNSVNDAPTNLAVSGDRDTVNDDNDPTTTDDTQYVVAPNGRIVDADGDALGFITVDDVETALADFILRIDGEHASSFSINKDNPATPYLERTGPKLADGATYSIRLVAIDEAGEDGKEIAMNLKIIEGGFYTQAADGMRTYSNAETPIILEGLDSQDDNPDAPDLGTARMVVEPAEKASATVTFADGSSLTFTAKTAGAAGNAATITIVSGSVQSDAGVQIGGTPTAHIITIDPTKSPTLAGIKSGFDSHVANSLTNSAFESVTVSSGSGVPNAVGTTTLSGGRDILYGYDLGEIGVEGGVENALEGEGIREFFLTDSPTNADFRISDVGGVPHLFYVGDDAGDFEKDESLTPIVGVRFVPRPDGALDASGNAGDADTRFFKPSFSLDTALTTSAEVISVSGGTITISDGTTVTFLGPTATPDVAFSGTPTTDTGFIIVTSNAGTGGANTGTVSLVENLPAESADTPAVKASKTFTFNDGTNTGTLTLTAPVAGAAGNSIFITFEAVGSVVNTGSLAKNVASDKSFSGDFDIFLTTSGTTLARILEVYNGRVSSITQGDADLLATYPTMTITGGATRVTQGVAKSSLEGGADATTAPEHFVLGTFTKVEPDGVVTNAKITFDAATPADALDASNNGGDTDNRFFTTSGVDATASSGMISVTAGTIISSSGGEVTVTALTATAPTTETGFIIVTNVGGTGTPSLVASLESATGDVYVLGTFARDATDAPVTNAKIALTATAPLTDAVDASGNAGDTDSGFFIKTSGLDISTSGNKISVSSGGFISSSAGSVRVAALTDTTLTTDTGFVIVTNVAGTGTVSLVETLPATGDVYVLGTFASETATEATKTTVTYSATPTGGTEQKLVFTAATAGTDFTVTLRIEGTIGSAQAFIGASAGSTEIDIAIGASTTFETIENAFNADADATALATLAFTGTKSLVAAEVFGITAASSSGDKVAGVSVGDKSYTVTDNAETPTATENGLTFTAEAVGTAGNVHSVEFYYNSEFGNDPARIGVTLKSDNSNIVVISYSSGATLTGIATAVNAHADASDLFTAAVVGDGTLTARSVFGAVPIATPLTGTPTAGTGGGAVSYTITDNAVEAPAIEDTLVFTAQTAGVDGNAFSVELYHDETLFGTGIDNVAVALKQSVANVVRIGYGKTATLANIVTKLKATEAAFALFDAAVNGDGTLTALAVFGTTTIAIPSFTGTKTLGEGSSVVTYTVVPNKVEAPDETATTTQPFKINLGNVDDNDPVASDIKLESGVTDDTSDTMFTPLTDPDGADKLIINGIEFKANPEFTGDLDLSNVYVDFGGSAGMAAINVSITANGRTRIHYNFGSTPTAEDPDPSLLNEIVKKLTAHSGFSAKFIAEIVTGSDAPATPATTSLIDDYRENPGDYGKVSSSVYHVDFGFDFVNNNVFMSATATERDLEAFGTITAADGTPYAGFGSPDQYQANDNPFRASHSLTGIDEYWAYQGKYGTLTLKSDGRVSYILDPDDTDTAALTKTAEDRINVIMKDADDELIFATVIVPVNLGSGERRDITVEPLTVLNVNEDQAAGALFTYPVTDADGDQNTYVLTSVVDADGTDVSSQFAINPATGQVSLASGSTFDFEASALYYIEITVTNSSRLPTDYSGAGEIAESDLPRTQTITKTVVLQVNNVNEAPTAVMLSNDVIEIPATGIPVGGKEVGTLSVTDQDADETHTYLRSGADASHFELRNSEGNIDPNGNVLWLKSTGRVPDQGSTWDLTITARDRGGLTTELDAPITHNGLFVRPAAADAFATLTFTGGATLKVTNIGSAQPVTSVVVTLNSASRIPNIDESGGILTIAIGTNGGQNLANILLGLRQIGQAEGYSFEYTAPPSTYTGAPFSAVSTAVPLLAAPVYSAGLPMATLVFESGATLKVINTGGTAATSVAVSVSDSTSLSGSRLEGGLLTLNIGTQGGQSPADIVLLLNGIGGYSFDYTGPESGAVFTNIETAVPFVRPQINSDSEGLLPEGFTLSALDGQIFTDNTNQFTMLTIDGAATRVYRVGELEHHLPDSGNNLRFTTSSSDFYAATDGKLYYRGTGISGDFEAAGGATLHTITVTATWTPTGEAQQTRTYTYVVNLQNLNDNAPTFNAPTVVAGTGATLVESTDTSPYQITGLDENIATGAEGLILFTASTTDADSVEGGVTDTVVYSLANGRLDNDKFIIDAATGAVRFKAGMADYEGATAADGNFNGIYQVEVTATNTDTLPDAVGATTKPSDTQVVEIALGNVNEAPSRIYLDEPVISGDDVTTSVLKAEDPDGGNPTFTFRLIQDGNALATDGKTTDTALFTITNGALVYTGPADDRKGNGESYDIRVEASDGSLAAIHIVEVSEGSLYIDPGIAAMGTLRDVIDITANGPGTEHNGVRVEFVGGRGGVEKIISDGSVILGIETEPVPVGTVIWRIGVNDPAISDSAVRMTVNQAVELLNDNDEFSTDYVASLKALRETLGSDNVNEYNLAGGAEAMEGRDGRDEVMAQKATATWNFRDGKSISLVAKETGSTWNGWGVSTLVSLTHTGDPRVEVQTIGTANFMRITVLFERHPVFGQSPQTSIEQLVNTINANTALPITATAVGTSSGTVGLPGQVILGGGADYVSPISERQAADAAPASLDLRGILITADDVGPEGNNIRFVLNGGLKNGDANVVFDGSVTGGNRVATINIDSDGDDRSTNQAIIKAINDHPVLSALVTAGIKPEEIPSGSDPDPALLVGGTEGGKHYSGDARGVLDEEKTATEASPVELGPLSSETQNVELALAVDEDFEDIDAIAATIANFHGIKITADTEGAAANSVGFQIVLDNTQSVLEDGAISIAATPNANGNYEIRMHSALEHRPTVDQLITEFNTAFTGKYTAVAAAAADTPIVTRSEYTENQITQGATGVKAEWIFGDVLIRAKTAGDTGTFGSNTINLNTQFNINLGTSPLEGGTGNPSFFDSGGGVWTATINYDVNGDDATRAQDIARVINAHSNLNQFLEASVLVRASSPEAAVKLSGGVDGVVIDLADESIYDNAQLRINEEGVLEYIGGATGNFEDENAPERTIRVKITETETGETSFETYEVRLADVNEAPTLMEVMTPEAPDKAVQKNGLSNFYGMMITADAGTDADNVGFIVIDDDTKTGGQVTIGATPNANGNYEIRMHSAIEHRPTVTELVTEFNRVLGDSFTAVANNPAMSTSTSASRITDGATMTAGQSVAKASKDFTIAGQTITVVAETAGSAGNNIRVKFVYESGVSGDLDVIKSGNDYTVKHDAINLGTLRALVNADPTAPFDIAAFPDPEPGAGSVGDVNARVTTDTGFQTLANGRDEVTAVPADAHAEWTFGDVYIRADQAGETGTFGSTTVNLNTMTFGFSAGGTANEPPSVLFALDGSNYKVTVNYHSSVSPTAQNVAEAINANGNLNQLVTASYKAPDGGTAAVKLSGDTSASGSYDIDDVDTGDTPTLQVRVGTSGEFMDVTSTLSVEATYGDLSINSAGVWSYTLDETDSDTEALTADATETFQIRVEDDGGLTTDVETLTIMIDVV